MLAEIYIYLTIYLLIMYFTFFNYSSFVQAIGKSVEGIQSYDQTNKQKLQLLHRYWQICLQGYA